MQQSTAKSNIYTTVQHSMCLLNYTTTRIAAQVTNYEY